MEGYDKSHMDFDYAELGDCLKENDVALMKDRGFRPYAPSTKTSASNKVINILCRET